jgi:hypothetical protein
LDVVVEHLTAFYLLGLGLKYTDEQYGVQRPSFARVPPRKEGSKQAGKARQGKEEQERDNNLAEDVNLACPQTPKKKGDKRVDL